MEEILERICKISSVCSCEEKLKKQIVNLVPKSCTILEDNLGNLIVKNNPKNKTKKNILLTANIDEQGLIITKIEEDGSLLFSPIGKITSSNLLIGETFSLNNQLDAVVGAKPIHLQTKKEKTKPLELKDLFLDIGCNSKKEAENFVKIGDIFAFKPKFEKTLNGYKSNFLGDKICSLVLIELLRSNLNLCFTAVFVVKEKAILNSAKTAAFLQKPDIAIILKPFETNKKNFNGVLAPVFDGTNFFNENLLKICEEVAKENKINFEKVIFKEKVNTANCFLEQTPLILTLAVVLNGFLKVSFCEKEDILNFIRFVENLVKRLGEIAWVILNLTKKF